MGSNSFDSGVLFCYEFLQHLDCLMSPQPVQTLMSAIHTDHPISSPKITIIIINVAEAGILISQEWVIVQLCATKSVKSHQSRKQEINFAPSQES